MQHTLGMNRLYTLPRSPYSTIYGVSMVARTADKARADAPGALGEYQNACRMSRLLFAFLKTDPDTFRVAATSTPDDSGTEAFVATRLRDLRRTPAEVDAFNRSIEAPPAPDAIPDFLEERHEALPNRRDIWTHVDLIDAEEGRAVPNRSDTPAWAV
jgi:hypothetical protein